MIKLARLKVSGRVQGMFYRGEAQIQALKLGLKGYAQNNRDGSVTVVAVGEEYALQQMIGWCWKGPDAAQAENVEVTYEELKPDEQFTGFGIY